jgi:hypothetical protein
LLFELEKQKEDQVRGSNMAVNECKISKAFESPGILPLTFKDLFAPIASLLPGRQTPVCTSRFPLVQQDFWEEFHAAIPTEKRWNISSGMRKSR